MASKHSYVRDGCLALSTDVCAFGIHSRVVAMGAITTCWETSAGQCGGGCRIDDSRGTSLEKSVSNEERLHIWADIAQEHRNSKNPCQQHFFHG